MAWNDRLKVSAACAAVALSAAVPAYAAYPDKPIRLLIPFAAGGGADQMGRLMGQQLSTKLRQPVVADNRAGGGGRIAAEMAAHAVPDGYTLFLGTHTTLVFAPALYKDLRYQPVEDFSPIIPFATANYVLVVNPGVRAQSVKELIALARLQPGNLKYASSGTGGPAQLASEMLNYKAGISTLHVPYKGSAPGTLSVVSGETDMMFSNVLPALPLIKSGRLRALGISSLKRSAALPNIPTIAESGLPGFDVYIFYGLVAPARTSRDIIRLLYDTAADALRQPEVSQRISADGGEPITGTPETFTGMIRSELATWTRLIRAAGLKGE